MNQQMNQLMKKDNYSPKQTITTLVTINKLPNEVNNANLSPFTWTHIKLPQINRNRQQKPSDEINFKVKKNHHQQKATSLEKQLKIIDKKQQKLLINIHLKNKVQLAANHHRSILQNRRYDNLNDLSIEVAHNKQKVLEKQKIKQKRNKSVQLKQPEQQTNKNYNTNAKLDHLFPIPIKTKYTRIKQTKPFHHVVLESPKNIYPQYKSTKFRAIVDTADPRKNHIKFKSGQIAKKSYLGNPPQFIKQQLAKIGWYDLSEVYTKDNPHLIWQSSDTTIQYNNIQQNQIINSISCLKNVIQKLRQVRLNSPIPRFCLADQSRWFFEQYQNCMVKGYLHSIVDYIEKYKKQYYWIEGRQKDNSKNILKTEPPVGEMCLGYLLPLLLPTEDKQTLNLISLCLYLEKYREDCSFGYFESMSIYTPIKVKINKKLNRNLINKIIETRTIEMKFNYLENVDERLLILLILYDKMLNKLDSSYRSLGQNNIWLVKSKSGNQNTMSFFQQKDYIEFQITSLKSQDSQWENQRREKMFKSQYGNKMVQKYIETPFLITNQQGQQRIKQLNLFFNKKFDIKQWVLAVTYLQKLIIYRFDDAYLRFCENQYQVDSLSMEKHIPHWSKAIKKLSLSLSAFLKYYPDLSSHVYTQLDSLIINTLLNHRNNKYQKGCFQLFEFTTLIDSNKKLWLLDIKSPPFCDTKDNKKLKEMVKTMVSQMMNIVCEMNISEDDASERMKQGVLVKHDDVSERVKQGVLVKHWTQIYPSMMRQSMDEDQVMKDSIWQLDGISIMKQMQKRILFEEKIEGIYQRVSLRIFFNICKTKPTEVNNLECENQKHKQLQVILQKRQINQIVKQINQVKQLVQVEGTNLQSTKKVQQDFIQQPKIWRSQNIIELKQSQRNSCCNQ